MEKRKPQMVNSTLPNRDNINARIKMFLASPLSFGCRMANSYFPVMMTDAMVMIIMNCSRVVKSEGLKRRLMIGVKARTMIRPMMEPVSKVRTFLEKSLFGEEILLKLSFRKDTLRYSLLLCRVPKVPCKIGLDFEHSKSVLCLATPFFTFPEKSSLNGIVYQIYQ